MPPRGAYALRMAQRRTETPLFRKALAAVALWLLAWATIGFLHHRAIPSFDQRAGYREAMQGCADDRLETSRSGALFSRPIGRLEMIDCTEQIRTRYLAAESADQRRVAVTTLAWALLPSLLLLLLAAFAPELRRQVTGRR